MRLPALMSPALLTWAALLAPAVAPSSGLPLERALADIRERPICSDVRFLADDALEGRDTPSRGLQVAARYIAARLERIGWEPGVGEGYLQTWSLEHIAVDPDRTSLRLEAETGAAHTLVFGDDYLFSGWEVQDHLAEGPIVFCGEGTREDIDGIDLRGAFALCYDSDLHANSRRNTVRRAGAVGLLVVPNRETGTLLHEDRLRRLALLALTGRVESGEERRPDMGGRAPLFHQAFLTESGARALFDLVGSDLRPGTRLGVVARDERRLPGDGGVVEVENVCALLPGRDPELADEVILVSAHYDHVGIIGGEIHNGADDNASGTASLLALAEALVEFPVRRTVMLLFVSGEEKGLYGSQAWAREPTLPEGSRAICDINLDMVGRNEPGELYVTPSPAHRAYNGLVELATRLAPLEGFAELGSADRYYDRSDHAVFAGMGMPVVFLFNGEHADYHRPSDTTDKIDCDKIRRVSRLVMRMIDALQDDDLGL